MSISTKRAFGEIDDELSTRLEIGVVSSCCDEGRHGEARGRRTKIEVAPARCECETRVIGTGVDVPALGPGNLGDADGELLLHGCRVTAALGPYVRGADAGVVKSEEVDALRSQSREREAHP